CRELVSPRASAIEHGHRELDPFVLHGARDRPLHSQERAGELLSWRDLERLERSRCASFFAEIRGRYRHGPGNAIILRVEPEHEQALLEDAYSEVRDEHPVARRARAAFNVLQPTFSRYCRHSASSE